MDLSIEKLKRQLAAMPGIGPKMAERLALYVLRAPAQDVDALINAMTSARSRIVFCPRCFNYTERTPCSICSDKARDGAIICVVEYPQDVDALERVASYRGLYHVLHGTLSPLDGIGPAQIKIQELLDRLSNGYSGTVKEVIVSTDFNMAGETTATYLAQKIKPYGILVTRIGSGLPVGGDLEYADELTLARALESRREL